MKHLLKGFLVFSLISTQFSLHAQNEKNRIGARLGYSSGFSYQHFYKTDRAFEGIFTFTGARLKLTGLTEWVNPARRLKKDGWSWYYGFGGHAGFQRKYTCDVTPEGLELCRYVLKPDVGFDGIFGMEHTFNHLPMSIGVDYKPSVNVLSEHKWPLGLVEFGFNCRYVF